MFPYYFKRQFIPLTGRIYFRFIVILVITYFFSGCVALRSADGLSANEMNVNYIAPLGGSIRYGISNKIETRLTITGLGAPYFDLYYHSHFDSSTIEYGLTAGYAIPVSQSALYFGLTLSKKLNDNFTPYVTFLNFSPVYYFEYSGNSSVYRKSSASYFSCGSEIKFYLTETKRAKFLLVPEVNYSPGPFAFDEQKSNFSAAINFGVIFTTCDIFK